MLRHPWARAGARGAGHGRSGGPRLHRVVLAILLDGGFSLDLAHHTMHVAGQPDLRLHPGPVRGLERRPDPEAEARLIAMLAVSFPALAELAAAVSHEGVLGACDDDVEFAFGLDLILDGLERPGSSRR